jgi:hypothetical protein
MILARIVGESNPGLTAPIGISILGAILVAILGSINKTLLPSSEENFWSSGEVLQLITTMRRYEHFLLLL